MKSAVIVFPGSNRDHDMMVALEKVTGVRPLPVWYAETDLPAVDLIVLPGGFSYGDYLRSGAIAALAPIMRVVAERAAAGVAVLGVCNGFHSLCEAGRRPGVLRARVPGTAGQLGGQIALAGGLVEGGHAAILGIPLVQLFLIASIPA